MDHLEDSFAPFPAGQALVERLIEESDHFGHLRSGAPTVFCVLSQRQLRFHGARALAFITQSDGGRGPLRELLTFLLAQFAAPVLEWRDPDYVIVFDVAAWDDLGHTPRGQEWLCHHELSHIVQMTDDDGNPKVTKEGRAKLALRKAHDHEFFLTEITEFGPYLTGLDGEVIPAIIEWVNAQKRLRGEEAPAPTTGELR